jgi:protoporphyrin/coproporphyrin ferrochelatase
MAYYNPEPDYKHGDQLKVGILLANLGTPDAPTAKALRPYLQQFLMDRRVVEIPRFIWCWILHCIILVIRPKKSAEKYASKYGQKKAHHYWYMPKIKLIYYRVI